MRIEDVGVEDAERIRRERVRHPRHDPDAPAAIVGVDAADAIDLEGERVGQHDRERGCGEHDERDLAEPARTGITDRMVAWGLSAKARSDHGATAGFPPHRLMDRLLELTHLAEQSHFWFRGFRWFIRPEIARAVAGRTQPRSARLRLRHRLEPGVAAGVRRGLRIRSHLERTGAGAADGPARHRAREHRRDSVRHRSLRRRHVVRRLPVPAGSGRARRDPRDVARAEARRPCNPERRRARHPARRSRGVVGRGPPLHARPIAPRVDRGRVRDRSTDVRSRDAAADHAAGPRLAALAQRRSARGR